MYFTIPYLPHAEGAFCIFEERYGKHDLPYFVSYEKNAPHLRIRLVAGYYSEVRIMPYAICHSERSEESYSGVKILHCVQDDKILSTPE
jgi:hypothetical protein